MYESKKGPFFRNPADKAKKDFDVEVDEDEDEGKLFSDVIRTDNQNQQAPGQLTNAPKSDSVIQRNSQLFLNKAE